MKKILYILDSRVGNIENQKNTIDYHFKVLLNNVEKEELTYYICGHEKFKNYIINNGYNMNYIGLEKETEQMSDREFGEYLKNRIGFVPDLILGYETNVSYLEEFFKESKIYSESFGAFSRFPWSSTVCFDKKGVYNKSTMLLEEERYRNSVYTEEDKRGLLKVRNFYWSILSKNFPKIIYDKIDNISNNKKILVPLQADNHISFNDCTDYKNHKDMIEDILRITPSNIDIIVTQHPDIKKATLNEEDLLDFKAKYNNFYYFKELENIPFVSQWILMYVDGVATVSSGLAFQAAILGIPVFSLGKSQINPVCSGTFEEAFEFLENEKKPKVENALWQYLKENMFYYEYMDVAILKTKIVKQLLNEEKLELTTVELLDKLIGHSREEVLKEFLKGKEIETINNELFTKITEAEAVSFDLFDTLVERPFFDPHDLFFLAENKIRRELGYQSIRYFHVRRKAEEEARKARNWKETTLEQIYYQFKKLTGLTQEEVNRIKEIELELETSLLFQKYNIMRYFNLCKRLGKKVSIITDIYHSKEVIEGFLKKVKIQGYDELYVSADLDLRKHDGTIYPLYLKELEVKYGIALKPKAILHIGDNPIADIEQALKFNLRTHHIYKSSDCLKGSELNKIFEKNIRKRWLTDSIVMGLISNRFNKKLETKHKTSLFGNDLHAFGYIAGGVMMLGFVQYVIEKVRKEKLDKVCFVARDGAILKDIYDILRSTGSYNDLPESDYLVLSRRATAVAVCETYEDFKKLAWLSFGERKLEDLLSDRFGVNVKDVPKEILMKHNLGSKDVINGNVDIGRLTEFLYDIKDMLIAQGEKERKGLLKYLEKKGINKTSKVCMVDIGYSGTIQANINKLLNSNIGGYYFLTHEAPRNVMENCLFDGWLESYDEQRSANYHPLNDYIFLFETLLSSEDLSITNYELDKSGNLIENYQECEDEASRIKFLRETHRGILDFTRDYVKHLKEYVRIPIFSKSLSMQVVMSLAKEPIKEDALMFLQLNVENKFGGGDAALVYGNKTIFDNLTDKNRELIIRNSQWKEGALSVVGHKVQQQVQSVKNQNQNKLTEENQFIKNKNIQTQDYINVKKTEEYSKIMKKYQKFKKNPYKFFKDSKNKYVRKLSYFYKDNR